jgi:hypothetical protein
MLKPMRQLSKPATIAIGLCILAGFVHAANPTAAPLHAGDVFPEFSGQTLTGKSLTLPAAAADRPAVLVFSFSRAAAKDARLWNEHMARDFPNTVAAYAIVVLESAPRVFRGLAISGMKSTMPVSAQGRTIMLYRDEELWKQRLAVTDERRAYVLVLAPSGTICWTSSDAFSGAMYTRLKNQLQKLSLPRP